MAKQLRKAEKIWYRADHKAANAKCVLIAGYSARLLKARGVSAGAPTSRKAHASAWRLGAQSRALRATIRT